VTKTNKQHKGTTPNDLVIAQRVRARRLEQHMSQETLAKQLGLTFQQVQKYEKGANRISSGRLVTIAAILETNINYFLGDLGPKDMKPSPITAFMATKDGMEINEAMMQLQTPALRRTVIELAKSLRPK
jgi:transcriptional regulator with XRE-family HTH domain